MDVSIERNERGDGVELVVAGRLDAECAGELARAVEEELRRGGHEILLDLDAVAFLSSAGIRVLFDIHRGAKAAGGRCLIRTASEPVRKVLELTRVASILMESAAHAAGGSPAAHSTAAAPQPARRPAAIHAEGVVFTGFEAAAPTPLSGVLVGSVDLPAGGPTARAERHPVPRDGFGLGIAALADDSPAARRAGEMAAACGAVFHRPPQPFAAVDYLVGSGDYVAETDLLSGLLWHGLPRGRTGFEPAAGSHAVRLDDLAARLLEQSGSPVIALVVAAEVQGLVGVELIRPLVEAAGDDRPRSPDRDVAARWLCFSREPVHARRTALVVGVVSAGPPVGPLADFVRPLGAGDVHGHLHAVVFPHRPLRRGGVDLVATIDDLSAAVPLALMHLLGDPQPVLGSGQSEFIRGACWFAPLRVGGARPASTAGETP